MGGQAGLYWVVRVLADSLGWADWRSVHQTFRARVKAVGVLQGRHRGGWCQQAWSAGGVWGGGQNEHEGVFVQAGVDLTPSGGQRLSGC